MVFWTRAPLVQGDTDDDADIYQRIDFDKQPGKSAQASGKRKKKGKAKASGRTRLVSAERIPPRIRIGAGRVRGGTAQVLIGCPKKEESGCQGKVRVAGGGSGSFKLKSGRSAWVSVGGSGAPARVVVKGRDALGNRAKARKRVSF